MLRHFPIGGARDKHAVEPVPSLPKKKGVLDHSEAAEALVLQGWPMAKCKTKLANQIKRWANRAVHAQEESARLKRKRMVAEEDGEMPSAPHPCTSTQTMEVETLGRYNAKEVKRVETLTRKEEDRGEEIFDALQLVDEPQPVLVPQFHNRRVSTMQPVFTKKCHFACWVAARAIPETKASGSLCR